jgi:hypothetical protein
MFCRLWIVMYLRNKNQQDALFYSQFISIFNFYMFRAGLLLIIRRYFILQLVCFMRFVCWLQPANITQLVATYVCNTRSCNIISMLLVMSENIARNMESSQGTLHSCISLVIYVNCDRFIFFKSEIYNKFR